MNALLYLASLVLNTIKLLPGQTNKFITNSFLTCFISNFKTSFIYNGIVVSNVKLDQLKHVWVNASATTAGDIKMLFQGTVISYILKIQSHER